MVSNAKDLTFLPNPGKKKKEIKFKDERTYSVSNNQMRACIVPAEVQTDLHARIPTPNNQNPLVSKIRTRLVPARMHHGSIKPLDPGDLRRERLGVFARGDDQPPANVLTVLSPDPPYPRTVIVLCLFHTLVEQWLNVEVLSVRLQVGNELLFRWVFWEIFWETKHGELTELFGEVELQAIVAPLLPQ